MRDNIAANLDAVFSICFFSHRAYVKRTYPSGKPYTLPVFDTPYGKIGALICWENYIPLARAAMYAKGVHIYITPTVDSRDV